MQTVFGAFGIEQVRQMLDQLPWPVLLAALDGRAVYANPAAARLLATGCSAPPAERVMDQVLAWVRRCSSDLDQGVRVEAWFRAGAANPLRLDNLGAQAFELRCHPLPFGAMWTIEDVSRAERLETALRMTTGDLERRVLERTQALDDARQGAERAQLSKTRFFAAASHDLLQPLNAARIFASSLAEQKDMSPGNRMIAERIDTALRSAEEVIDVLVDVAKLDTGAVRAVIETFDLHDLLRSLCEQFSSVTESRRLQLRLRLGPGRYLVRSDRRLLRRVLQNLLSNALRYTERGGVLVGVRRWPDSMLRIDVVDSGLGIPAESLPLAFQEFQRIGRGSPWGEKGLGLGLSICERICALLGHELIASSVVGRGSRFSVVVPRIDSGGMAGSARHVPLMRVAESPRLALDVLCVDDDADVLDAMVTLVGGWGAQMARAHSRDSALDAARQRRPDVLLVDYQFDDDDGTDGLQIIMAVRALYAADPPMAILISANRSNEVKARARALNVNLLQKPLRAARLRSLLEAAVRQ